MATDLAEQFEFLDGIRESGITNMFGAGRYLEEAFILDRKSAGHVLSLWIKSFDSERSAADRAEQAVSA